MEKNREIKEIEEEGNRRILKEIYKIRDSESFKGLSEKVIMEKINNNQHIKGVEHLIDGFYGHRWDGKQWVKKRCE